MNIGSIIEYLNENEFEEIEYNCDKDKYNINISYYFDEDEISAAEYCNNGDEYTTEEYEEFLKDIVDDYTEEIIEEIEETYSVKCRIKKSVIDSLNQKADLILALSM